MPGGRMASSATRRNRRAQLREPELLMGRSGLDLPAVGITTFTIASDHAGRQCADLPEGHDMNEHQTAGHEADNLKHGHSGPGGATRAAAAGVESSLATDPVC